MSEGDAKPIKDRVAELEEEIQGFITKFEHGLAKGETVGAAGAATGAAGSLTGISGEGTILSGGVKLWNFEWDMRAEKEKRDLRNARQLPHQLAEDIDAVKRLATEGRDRADQRITDLSRDLNEKIRRKADISALRQTADRHDSRLEGLRSSQVNALRREAQQTRASVQALEDEIDRLNARF
ncbi:hypothetical protein ACH4D5_13215 [Streptomyces sp. NPDC018029]|uniref:hypothetical protein n=1 Tax=Streptomyces sp. NPDC018029 TaxID=3365032 RepID=UPI0037877448